MNENDFKNQICDNDLKVFQRRLKQGPSVYLYYAITYSTLFQKRTLEFQNVIIATDIWLVKTRVLLLNELYATRLTFGV